MESPICFRILINRNFGDFEIKISKCNRSLEQPGMHVLGCIVEAPRPMLLSVNELHCNFTLYLHRQCSSERRVVEVGTN